MGRLDNKVAIITGAGSGMGRIAAIMFAKEGAKVVVADVNKETGEETVKMVKETGGDVKFIATDMKKAASVKDMVEETVKAFGKVNVLYNNAALGEPAAADTTTLTEENWDLILSVDLKGAWLAMKYAIPEMLKAGGGSIVNTTSQAATRGNAGLPSYTAAKGGLLSLSRCTAVEFADKNIRVNCISPGYVKTPMLMGFLEAFPEMVKKVIDGTPQRRIAEPEEIASVALFLASDESSHITAAEIPIDGGIANWSNTM